MKKVLTIAGSDSCGGAGIQADLKTFSALGVYGMSVITAITAQNTQGVFGIQDISTDLIQKQITAIFDDIEVDGIKIGMVSNTHTIQAIAESLQAYPIKNLVLDPVMVSKSGHHLLQPQAKHALIQWLLPLATLITPNLPEAEVITERSITSLEEMKAAAQLIHEKGPAYVLVKGGHLAGDPVDVLFDGQEFILLQAPRIDTRHTHGTGCTLSSAIAAHLALGWAIDEAVSRSKAYITTAIAHALEIGKGIGPTHHFYELYQRAGLHDSLS